MSNVMSKFVVDLEGLQACSVAHRRCGCNNIVKELCVRNLQTNQSGTYHLAAPSRLFEADLSAKDQETNHWLSNERHGFDFYSGVTRYESLGFLMRTLL